MKDLKGLVIRGGIVRVGSQAFNFIVRLGGLVVLARLLEPEDFGLVAMVTAVTGIFNRFSDLGLSAATVQRSSITPAQISSLFWINVLVGSILGILTIAIAPILATFYGEPRLVWVTAAVALGFIVNAAGVQHSALLQRKMRFIALSVIENLALLVSVAVGIVMAVMGYRYWALVGMALTLSAFSTGCLWFVAAWIPDKPCWEERTGSMVRFGGTVTLNSIVVYVAFNADKVLLGRYWGAGVLGFYERAYQLINIPAENFNSAIGGVAFPALSRLQEDPDRLKYYFLNGYSLVLALSLPITIACALYAEEIIYVFLGSKWMESVTLYRVLAPTVLVFALINPFSWYLLSIGMVKRSLKIALVLAPLVIGAYVMGLPYGAFGVAFAYSAIMLLWVTPHIAWCIHGTSITLKDIWIAVSKPLFSAIVAGAISLAVHNYVSQYMAPLSRLVLGFVILSTLYLLMLLYVMKQKKYYFDLLCVLKKRSVSIAA